MKQVVFLVVLFALVTVVPSALAIEQSNIAPIEGSVAGSLIEANNFMNETQTEEQTTYIASSESPPELNEVELYATLETPTGFYYPTDCHEFWNTGTGWLDDDDENYYHYWASGVYHTAVDIYAPAGSNAYAIADGEILRISDHSSWDSDVEELSAIYIKHYTNQGQPFVAVYGHLRNDVDDEEAEEKIIEAGKRVAAGQTIGHVGRFDRKNGEPYGGSHVHFAISASDDNSASGCGGIDMAQHRTYALVDPLNWIDSVSPGPYPAAIAYNPEIVVTKDLSIIQTGNTLTATFTVQNNGAEEITLKELYVSGRYKYVSSTSGTLPSGEYPDFIKVKDLTLQPSATYTYTSCYVIPYTGDYEFFIMSVDSNGEKCWLIPKNDGAISSRWFYANLFGTGSTVRSNPASISPGTTVPPGTGATVTPTLSWEPVTGAEGYRIFISECDEKGSVTNSVIYRYPETGGEPIQGTSFASIPEGILQTGKYYCWNFEPMIGGAWSEQYSPIRFFQVAQVAQDCSIYFTSNPPNVCIETRYGTSEYVYINRTPATISWSELLYKSLGSPTSSDSVEEDQLLSQSETGSIEQVEIKFTKYGYQSHTQTINLGELSSINAELTPETPPPDFTDLIVSRVWTSEDILPGREVHINAEIINDGDISCGPFFIGVWTIDDQNQFQLIGKKEITSLPEKTTTTISGWTFTWPNDYESHSVFVFVDCNGEVNETDEINNLFPGTGAAHSSQTSNPPQASFTAIPSSGDIPLTVEFTDTSTGGPTSWLWDFGDGQSASGPNPVHTYHFPRTYSASLTVSNSEGSDTAETTIQVFRPSGRTYTVGPSGCDFTKIQDAVYAADDWDRIEVMSGTYYENVIVNKSLFIQGRDTGGGIPTIDGQWLDTVVKIIADNVSFSNFEVINSKSTTYYQACAGICIQSNNVDIVSCAFTDNSYGVYMPWDYDNVFISSSTFEYNSQGGIYASHLTVKDVSIGYSSSGYGIRLFDNSFLQNVTVYSGSGGILFYSNNTIIDSEVRDNTDSGIQGDSDNNLRNLRVINNRNRGISLANRNTLTDINANENGAVSSSSSTRITVQDDNTLKNVSAVNQEDNYRWINIGSRNTLSDITGSVETGDTSQYNTITDLIGDLKVNGPYNTIQNVKGSIDCNGDFNEVHSVCGVFTTRGNRNVASGISGAEWSYISGNENIIDDLRVSGLSIEGSRNQVKSFEASSASLGGSRNILTNGKISGNGNYQTTGLSVGGERGTVQKVCIKNCGKGIDFLSSQYAVVKDVIIENCSTGVSLGKIYNYDSSSSYETLTNAILKNSGGIYISDHQSSPAVLTNISMINTSGGLSFWNCRDLVVSDISMTGSITSMACIEMYESKNNTISNFKCENTRSDYAPDEEWYYAEGIQLYNSPKNSFHNGVISNFTNGISLQSSNLNEFSNVSIFGNRIGVIISNSNGTIIQMMDNYHNTWSGLEMYTTDNTSVWLSNFINTNNTHLQNAKNTRWYSQNPVQYTFNGITKTDYLGNSWRGYSGIDADGDGIGDAVHVINQTVDQYPLVNYWQYYTGKTQSLPPSAGFVANVTEGRDELTVRFTDTSAGTVTSRRWNFGDGITSSEREPVHTYHAPGYYNVTFTVENAWGSDSLTREGYIHVDTLRPYANFTAAPVNGDAPLTVNFIDTSQYGPEEWYWTFGDGNTSTEQNTVHTYTVSGNYTVGLTVSNDYGSTSISKTNYIHVIEPPIKTALSFDPATSAVQMGEATGFNIVFDNAHNGLAGFNVTVALTNSSVGEIVGVSYPSWANMPVNGSLPADTVQVQAVDLARSVETGAKNVTLCTVFVRGDATGKTNLTITATKVDDDDAGRYEPAVIDATLTVHSILPFPNPAGGNFPAPTDPNGDGRYEDLDGNGFVGFNDVVVYYQNMGFIESSQPLTAFDYDGSSFVGFNDVVSLYRMV